MNNARDNKNHALNDVLHCGCFKMANQLSPYKCLFSKHAIALELYKTPPSSGKNHNLNQKKCIRW